MVMKIFNDKKYNTIAAYAIATFAVCLLLVIIIFRFSALAGVVRNFLHILNPIIWGVAIAYLLNPIMMFFERLFVKAFDKKKPHKKLNRYLSIAVTSILTLLVIISIAAVLIPQIIGNISNIASNMPAYFENMQEWFDDLLENNPMIMDFVNSEFKDFQTYITDAVNKFQPQLQSFVSNLTLGILNFAVGVKDFLLGFIVMIYLLASKETFIAQAKKIMYALLPEKACSHVMYVARKSNTTFIGFISGKVLDSFIIGVLCFIAMTLMGMPLTVLISVIVGITNMIPFFGPFIGAIPSALLILLVSPDKLVAFVVFIIILQQFDGNILGPKILGDSTGLPSFWVLFAIFIGGGLFGFAGMLLCVPVFAVIYTLAKQLIENRLKAKNLPVGTKEYMDGKENEKTQ
ncbi:MAG: AI-2E family transporter [Oscillospiraceae bacterium]|nr:AI-2E family transporter [Oscillospiraceae bacterium]